MSVYYQIWNKILMKNFKVWSQDLKVYSLFYVFLWQFPCLDFVKFLSNLDCHFHHISNLCQLGKFLVHLINLENCKKNPEELKSFPDLENFMFSHLILLIYIQDFWQTCERDFFQELFKARQKQHDGWEVSSNYYLKRELWSTECLIKIWN